MTSADDRTIADFGVQWTEFTEATGWWGSVDGHFRDQIEPLMKLEAIAGKRCCDIGSGIGRVVRNLIAAGAAHVTAIEPSPEAFNRLTINTRDLADRVTLINARGEAVPACNFDLITCLGVLHHVVDPAPIVLAAHRGLREGGEFLVWVYGREGNRVYLSLAKQLRHLTLFLPLWALKALCAVLTMLADVYALLCRIFPFPLASYFTQVYAQFDWSKRFLAVFDQLHTTHAKYYSRAEALSLLEDGGFQDVKVYHRHRYSWSISGRK